jgi:hypothetical protein
MNASFNPQLDSTQRICRPSSALPASIGARLSRQPHPPRRARARQSHAAAPQPRSQPLGSLRYLLGPAAAHLLRRLDRALMDELRGRDAEWRSPMPATSFFLVCSGRCL